MVIDPAFLIDSGRQAYAELETLGEPVMIHERTPAGFIDHGPVQAFVAAYRREDLVPGGPIEQGDLRATFNRATWPPLLTRRLQQGDRVTWRGDLYAVMNQDDATRSAGGAQFGVDLQLRGGAG